MGGDTWSFDREMDEDEAAAFAQVMLESFKTNSLAQGRPLVEKKLDSVEEELKAQQYARDVAAADGLQIGDKPVQVFHLEEAASRVDPEGRYDADKSLLEDTMERGDIQLAEESCRALLARKPDDPEVWNFLVQSRLRLRIWDVALEAVRRWIRFDPYSLEPRTAECLALAGNRQFGEARARLSQLATEVENLDPATAAELRECVWRVDELWMEHEPETAKLSARPATVISGCRAPHFYLPNFADSIGPVKVLPAEAEDLGGGHNHRRRMVLTKDVEPGDLLFVQTPLVFGAIDDNAHIERLGDTLFTVATTSPRAAAFADHLVAMDKPQPEGEDLVAMLQSDETQRDGGTWSRDANSMSSKMEDCMKVVERSSIMTGRSFAGIWTLMAQARHSCVPSAVWTVFGDSMVARACRSLRCGDEVTFALFDHFNTLETRQTMFTENFGGFWCRCARCEAEQKLADVDVIEHASLQVKARFEAQEKRLYALKEELTVKTEKKKLEWERRFSNMSPEGERQYKEGLLGLGEKFRNLNGRRLDDDDLEEVREYLPEMNEHQMVKVPQDLIEDLIQAIDQFEEDVDKAELDDQHLTWVIASHLPYYTELILLLRLRQDLFAQKRLLGRMLPAVEACAPGSFVHQRLCVLNWELAAQIEDPELKTDLNEDIGAAEKDYARKCVRIRYGQDLSPIEEEAALARTACSRDLDENWMWDINWCVGRSNNEEDEEDEEEYQDQPRKSDKPHEFEVDM